MSQNLSFQDDFRTFGAFTEIFNKYLIYFLLVVQKYSGPEWILRGTLICISHSFTFHEVDKKSKHEERYHHQVEQSGVWDGMGSGRGANSRAGNEIHLNAGQRKAKPRWKM